MSFVQARRAALKGRVALCGPTGSGKTWTALGWARQLGDRVALIDTERRSASLYADEFKFDTCAIDPPYHPKKLIDALREAEGYDVVVIDSLSHFWEGEGGILEIVDSAAQRSPSKNSYAAWGVGTPIQRHMVDSILGFGGHVIVTMRSKMDYIQEKDDKTGKTRIVKLGMAPVQRAGVEYEFTVIGDLDQEHRLVISKSRCHPLADRVIQPGRQEDAAVEFRAWLGEGVPADEFEVGDATKGAPIDELPAGRVPSLELVEEAWALIGALPNQRKLEWSRWMQEKGWEMGKAAWDESRAQAIIDWAVAA